jgi:hypothetical protein
MKCGGVNNVNQGGAPVDARWADLYWEFKKGEKFTFWKLN